LGGLWWGSVILKREIQRLAETTFQNNLSKLWGKFAFKVERGGAERLFLRMATPRIYLFPHDFKNRGGVLTGFLQVITTRIYFHIISKIEGGVLLTGFLQVTTTRIYFHISKIERGVLRGVKRSYNSRINNLITTYGFQPPSLKDERAEHRSLGGLSLG